MEHCIFTITCSVRSSWLGQTVLVGGKLSQSADGSLFRGRGGAIRGSSGIFGRSVSREATSEREPWEVSSVS